MPTAGTAEVGLITDVLRRRETSLGRRGRLCVRTATEVEAAWNCCPRSALADKRIFYDKFTTTGDADESCIRTTAPERQRAKPAFPSGPAPRCSRLGRAPVELADHVERAFKRQPHSRWGQRRHSWPAGLVRPADV